MRSLTTSSLGVLLLLAAAELSHAKEWRGLVPLRSTRSDVIRLLNQCSDQKEACRFKLETESVHILFSGGLPPDYSKCATRIPPETVMFISVEPTVKLKLGDLRLDKRTLQTFNPSAPLKRDLKGYSSNNGIVLSLFKERILQVVYFADEPDKYRCFGFYQRPESFVEVSTAHFPTIDSIDGPERVKAGELVKLTAYSDFNEARGYEWTVSAGRIVAGQYTKQVTIDTAGLAGQKLIATAEIGDVFSHFVAGSITIQILPP